MKQQTNLTEFSAAMVGDRPGVRFRVNGTEFADRCDVAYPTRFGLIWASILVSSFEQRVDTCKFVDRWAAIVQRNAPR